MTIHIVSRITMMSNYYDVVVDHEVEVALMILRVTASSVEMKD